MDEKNVTAAAPAANQLQEESPAGVERLQKLISERGFCSRRKAEELIVAKRVTVDGTIVDTLGASFDPDCEIVIDGTRLPTRSEIESHKVYIALNKPLGFICTASDPQHRRLVTDLVPPRYGRVYPVGRLDINSEGLVFLTNDGEFANLITHPSSAPAKVYEVTIDDRLSSEQKERLAQGIVLEDGLTAPCQVREIGISLDPKTGAKNGTYRIVLHEGKNREVRRMMAYFGHRVLRLRRTQIGLIKLGKLRKGSFVVIPEKVVAAIVNDCRQRKIQNDYKIRIKGGTPSQEPVEDGEE